MSTQHSLLLADDDADDCIFFKEALQELPISANLETVNDGVKLMQLLAKKTNTLPDILFLDLNMPRKNGFECLSEIKVNKEFTNLPVIIFSTSFDRSVIDLLYENGAHYYMRKPGEFSKLKQIIHTAISLSLNTDKRQPAKEKFVLNTE